MAIRNYSKGALVESWDAGTGLYTRFNGMGTVAEQRELAATELAVVRAHDRGDAESGAVAQAKQQIDTIHADTAAYRAQLAADVASVQAGGWQALDGDTQTAIVLRMLNGFTAVMSGLVAHAAVTGAIDPLDTPQEAP